LRTPKGTLVFQPRYVFCAWLTGPPGTLDAVTAPHAPAALAALLVAAYVDRDGRQADALINGLTDRQRQQLLDALGALARSTRTAVSGADGHVPGVGDARSLDERVHEVLAQVTDVDTEAALQSYLHRPRTMPGETPAASAAEVTAMVHASAAYAAVLMESRPIPPTVLAAGLRAMARHVQGPAPEQ